MTNIMKTSIVPLIASFLAGVAVASILGRKRKEDDTVIDSEVIEEKKEKCARWPWDTIPRKVSFVCEDDSETMTLNKTGYCIGSIFGLDVGGTLAKLVWFEVQAVRGKKMKKSVSMFDLKSHGFEEALSKFYTFARQDSFREPVQKEKSLEFYSRKFGGDFHFTRFETRKMKAAVELFKRNDLHVNIVQIGATGGGAHKYAKDWETTLGIKMQKHDELDCLVAGLQYVLADVVGECYTFMPSQNYSQTSQTDEAWLTKVPRDQLIQIYPYLIVTIGTGVSILRVDGPRKHERISGSTIGGGTYWGLCRLLTDVQNFEDAMNLAAKGDPTKVDLLVGDIYGNNDEALEKLGLPADIVASSFGKLIAKQNPASDLKQEDLARALLIMVTNNIGQVAYLNAQLHNITRIYFVGNFLRHNDISQRRLAYAINYWSKGKMEAIFLLHEGYFGALGAFLLNYETQLQRYNA